MCPASEESMGHMRSLRLLQKSPKCASSGRMTSSSPCAMHAGIEAGAGSVEERTGDQDSMEQAEHDLLADLRRARRSLGLQDMEAPSAVACLTPGQRIA